MSDSPPFARCPRPRRFGVLLAVAFLSSCAATSAPDSGTAPLLGGLGRYGRVENYPASGSRLEVVLLSDRHAINVNVGVPSPQLAAIQRETRDALVHLIDHGFQLLGCEASEGALPTTENADRQRARVAAAVARGRDPSDLLVYQPLRYEVEFQGRMTVFGAEDPTLYANDVDRLTSFRQIGRRLVLETLTDAEKQALEAEQRSLLLAIRNNATTRGQAAARRLLARMDQEGVAKGVLLIGGAHGDGAAREFLDQGVALTLFHPRSYRVQEELP